MAKLFKRRDPNTLTERQQDFQLELLVGACWCGVGAVVLAIGGPIVMYFDHQGMKTVRAEEERTEQAWDAGISNLELEHGITKLKLDAVPSYARNSDVLYIGRGRYVDKIGRECVAPIIGEDSGILIPEDNRPFPDISLVIEKEVCTS